MAMNIRNVGAHFCHAPSYIETNLQSFITWAAALSRAEEQAG